MEHAYFYAGDIMAHRSVLRAAQKGAQEFKIPEETDLSRYRSLLIHCRQYTKLWGGTSLRGS